MTINCELTVKELADLLIEIQRNGMQDLETFEGLDGKGYCGVNGKKYCTINSVFQSLKEAT